MMQYKHLFFDLDHTLWDFEANSRQTLEEMYHTLLLQERGVHSFDEFFGRYIAQRQTMGTLPERVYKSGRVTLEAHVAHLTGL